MSICLKIPWYSWIHLNILGSKKVEYIPLLKSFHWYSDHIWSFFFVCWSSLSFSVRLLGKANPVAAWGFSLTLYFTTRWVYRIRIFTAVYLNIITYQSFIFNHENYTVMKALLFAVCKELSLSVVPLAFQQLFKVDCISDTLPILWLRKLKLREMNCVSKFTQKWRSWE